MAAPRAEEIIARAELWLRRQYGDHPGFELRKDLYWPAAAFVQRQLNLHLGECAGLEVHFRQAQRADHGRLTVRVRGRLEMHLQVGAAGLGVVVAALTFLVLAWSGLVDGTFIAGSRALATPHFHAGAFLLGTLPPAALAGLVAGACCWPLSWLCRPLCSFFNRRAGLADPAALLHQLTADR